jgi:hypothetical protein
MDERDGVELQQQQQSQSRHSIMKKDKKTENRFKSKFGKCVCSIDFL